MNTLRDHVSAAFLAGWAAGRNNSIAINELSDPKLVAHACVQWADCLVDTWGRQPVSVITICSAAQGWAAGRRVPFVTESPERMAQVCSSIMEYAVALEEALK